MYVWSAHSSMEEPGMAVNPARGVMTRENNVSLSLFTA